MVMLNNDNSRFWVKDMRRTTVILASRAAPPNAAGSQKFMLEILDKDCQTCHSAAGPRLNASYCVLTSSQDKHLLNYRD